MKALLFAALCLAATSAQAGTPPFDWDRYHDRLDACSQLDELRRECVRGYCDETAMRRLQRECAPFSDRR